MLKTARMTTKVDLRFTASLTRWRIHPETHDGSNDVSEASGGRGPSQRWPDMVPLLRGTAASLLSSEDVSSPKIDKWLGHVTPGIAGRYITIQDADLVKIAAVMRSILAPVWG
jgi:hypothetical protein